MSQSRASSALEAGANVAVGSLLAVGTQLVLFPVVGLQATLAQNLTIGSVFTGLLLVRSYVLRRLFDRMGERRCRVRS